MNSTKLKLMAGTLLRVFLAAVLAQTIAVGGDFGGDGLRTVLAAGIAAAATVVANWINPADGRYGIGS